MGTLAAQASSAMEIAAEDTASMQVDEDTEGGEPLPEAAAPLPAPSHATSSASTPNRDACIQLMSPVYVSISPVTEVSKRRAKHVPPSGAQMQRFRLTRMPPTDLCSVDEMLACIELPRGAKVAAVFGLRSRVSHTFCLTLVPNNIAVIPWSDQVRPCEWLPIDEHARDVEYNAYLDLWPRRLLLELQVDALPMAPGVSSQDAAHVDTGSALGPEPWSFPPMPPPPGGAHATVPPPDPDASIPDSLAELVRHLMNIAQAVTIDRDSSITEHQGVLVVRTPDVGDGATRTHAFVLFAQPCTTPSSNSEARVLSRAKEVTERVRSVLRDENAIVHMLLSPSALEFRESWYLATRKLTPSAEPGKRPREAASHPTTRQKIFTAYVNAMLCWLAVNRIEHATAWRAIERGNPLKGKNGAKLGRIRKGHRHSVSPAFRQSGTEGMYGCLQDPTAFLDAVFPNVESVSAPSSPFAAHVHASCAPLASKCAGVRQFMHERTFNSYKTGGQAMEECREATAPARVREQRASGK